MEESFTSLINAAAIVSAGTLIGMLIGYAFARGGQRRRGSTRDGVPKSEYEQINNDYETLSGEYDTLRSEYDGYRGRVESHFRETSKAFQKTTEQYRSLYQQIASGAVELCDASAVKPILETAASASNAVTSVTAATTEFDRKDDQLPGEGLSNALSDMRAEMTELDQAIDDLKADVLEPKRKELRARGIIKPKTPEVEKDRDLPLEDRRETPVLRPEQPPVERTLVAEPSPAPDSPPRLDVRPDAPERIAATIAVPASRVAQSQPAAAERAPHPTPVQTPTPTPEVATRKVVTDKVSTAVTPEIQRDETPPSVTREIVPDIDEEVTRVERTSDYGDLPPMTFGGRELSSSQRRRIDTLVEDDAVDGELVHDSDPPRKADEPKPVNGLVPRRRLSADLDERNGPSRPRDAGKRLPRLVPDNTNGSSNVYDFVDDEPPPIRLER